MSDTLENIGIGVGGAAAGAGASYIVYDAWRRAAERTVLDGKPATSTRVDAANLTSDADTFQFKSGGDRSGVTDRLQGIKKWNAAAAGKVMVYEYADGRQVIADGHQRLGLAKRLMGDGHAPIKMDAIVLKQQDGWSPRDVRAYAAIKNMHESSGNAIDMARVMRDRPDLVTSSLPVSDAKVREAKALSRLSHEAFGSVVSGAVEPGVAAAVADGVPDSSRHVAMIKEMIEAKVKGSDHARLYVQQAMSAPSVSETTASLFGAETQVRSLIKERTAVLHKALTSLKSNRKLFGMLEREADTIEAAGNKLDRATNASKADISARLGTLVEKLATQRGHVSSMLDDAARLLANGDTAPKAARTFLKAVQTTMEKGGIKALVGDGPMPLAANGGMQRMVDTSDRQAEFRAMLAETRARYEYAENMLSREMEKPHPKLAVTKNGMTTVLTKDPGGNGFRVTSILNGEPIGHRDYPNARPGSQDMRMLVQDMVSGGLDVPKKGDMKRMAGKKGQTSFLPDATTKEQISAAMKAKGKPGVPQQDVGGLFGDGMKQMDLVDEARKAKAKSAEMSQKHPAGMVQSKYATNAFDARIGNQEFTAYVEREGKYGWKVRGVTESAIDPRYGAATFVKDHRVSGYYPTPQAAADAALNSVRPGWSDAARQASAEARAVDPYRTLSNGDKMFTKAENARRLAEAKALPKSDPTRGMKIEHAKILAGTAWRPDGSAYVPALNELMEKTLREDQAKAFAQTKRGARAGKKAADMDRIKQQIKDTLGPRGDGKHRHVDGTPITKENMNTTMEQRAAAKPAGPLATSRPKGKKTEYAVRIGDKIVDTRVSDRTYTHAIVARHSFDFDMKSAGSIHKVDHSNFDYYAEIARAPADRFRTEKFIAEAKEKVAKYGDRDTYAKAKMEERVAGIKAKKAAGHYDKPVVVAWAGRPDLASKQVASLGNANGWADVQAVEVGGKGGRPVGWSDAARQASADARGVAAPGKAKQKASSGKVEAKTPSAKALKSSAKAAGVRDPNAAFAEVFGKTVKSAGKKGAAMLGPVAVIGAGAVAFDATRNKANAAGMSGTTANLSAVGAGVAASGTVAGVGYGISKAASVISKVAPVAGKVLARALPAVAIAGVAYEAGKGAIKGYRKGGVVGAVKGAGEGALDFASMGAYSHFVGAPGEGGNTRLTSEQQQQFAQADQHYRAMQDAKKADGTASGWSDQARISAYISRVSNAGGTPENLPYGGAPRAAPAEPKTTSKKRS